MPLTPVDGATVKNNLQEQHQHNVSTVSCTTPTTLSSDWCRDDDCGLDAEYDDNFVMTQDDADKLVSRTQRKVRAFLEKSAWVKANSTLADIPRLTPADFTTSRVVAEGGFSSIHEITAFHHPKDPNLKCVAQEQQRQRQQVPGSPVPLSITEEKEDTTDEIQQQEQRPKRYVVKHLKSELTLNQHNLKAAMKDICNEIHILSATNHQHIIKLQAISSAGLQGCSQTCRADSLFLVLERLDQTLLHKISQWRQEGIRKQALDLTNLGTCSNTLALFRERVQVAQQLASALCYLHDRRIMHRDIKPGNIGFDADGKVQLFDFGIAVEIPHSDDPSAVFDLGNAGAARYQAPEVINKKPYNISADLYSFTLVLWEMMALSKAFPCLTGEEVKESVTLIGCRPIIPKAWPKDLKRLLQSGWSRHPKQRPSMADMEVNLEAIFEKDYSKKKKSVRWFKSPF